MLPLQNTANGTQVSTGKPTITFTLYIKGILYHHRESQKNMLQDITIHSCGPILSTTGEKIWCTHLHGDIHNYDFTLDKKELLENYSMRQQIKR
jgi:hypothetical protein